MDKVDILLELMDRPIAFHRAFVRLGVGITGALMLGQAVYWSRRTDDAQGWFYKTQADWEEETGMTRREQEGARARLRELGLLHEAKRGVPCKTFYRVDFETLLAVIHKTAQNRLPSLHKTAKQDCTKAPSSAAQKRQSITETTQGLQQENKKERASRSSAMPADFAPTEQHRQLAAQLGVALDAEFAKFQDYHASKASRFVDWHAALRTWLRNAAKFTGAGGRVGQGVKTAPAAHYGAANGFLLDADGKPKDYMKGIDDDGNAIF